MVTSLFQGLNHPTYFPMQRYYPFACVGCGCLMIFKKKKPTSLFPHGFPIDWSLSFSITSPSSSSTCVHLQTQRAASTHGGSSTATATDTSAGDTRGRTPRRTAGSTAATWRASTARPSRTSSEVRGRGGREQARHRQCSVCKCFFVVVVVFFKWFFGTDYTAGNLELSRNGRCPIYFPAVLGNC